MSEKKTILSLCAHPDDAEFMCTGTMALLKERGWEVHIATMGPGNCGTNEYSLEEISRIRRQEGKNAAAVIGAGCHDLDCDDIFIMYNRETLIRAITLMRKLRPMVVITQSPRDYMVDHEHSTKIAQTACFCTGMPNIATPGYEPYEPVPYLYYSDPMGGHDILGNVIEGNILVDVSSQIETKAKMLCCHESQRNWLLDHHGIDEYILSMKRIDSERGRRAGVSYGEAFRQHLGHGYPSDNILKAELGDLVHLL